MNVNDGRIEDIEKLNALVKDGKEKKEDWVALPKDMPATVVEYLQDNLNRHERRFALKLLNKNPSLTVKELQELMELNREE